MSSEINENVEFFKFFVYRGACFINVSQNIRFLFSSLFICFSRALFADFSLPNFYFCCFDCFERHDTRTRTHIKSNKRLLKFYVRVFSVAIPFYGFFRCKVKYFHHLSAFVCFRRFVLSFLRLFTEKMCSPSGPKYF